MEGVAYFNVEIHLHDFRPVGNRVDVYLYIFRGMLVIRFIQQIQ